MPCVPMFTPQSPDHICFTGDLVNIAAKAEFRRGLQWLKTVGTPENLTMVPGNHDAYVHVAHETGLGLLNPYMEGDGASSDHIFPFVRLRRNVAIIGVSSALPQSLNRAGGTLGKEQRNALATRLADLGARGFYRLVMIHHPPLPGLTPARRALTDASELQRGPEGQRGRVGAPWPQPHHHDQRHRHCRRKDSCHRRAICQHGGQGQATKAPNGMPTASTAPAGNGRRA